MWSFSSAEHQTFCTSNACFTLNLDRVNFKKAQLNCENDGGYLMTITNSEEEDVLRTLLSQSPQQVRPFKVHIGLKLHRMSCVDLHTALRGFKWVSGEDSQYSNWKKNPVNTCTQRCVSVHYYSTGHNHMKWTDGSCKSLASYVCKFYFKGMCKALVHSGLGEITYTAPFSQDPQKYQMKILPVGTYAIVQCDDQQTYYSVCNLNDDVYSWTNAGPFCTSDRNCATQNGGCEHVCSQKREEVICSCNNGYELDEDGFSCRLENMCYIDTCQYLCVMGETGFTCQCPQGLKLDLNQRTCSDIDECQSDVCGEHLCENSEGSYRCFCKTGYEMIGGDCVDANECESTLCEHFCLNSIGSFSCQCNEGFQLSEDGLSCEDINECLRNSCKFECVNTPGSFVCVCPIGFQLDRNGVCFPDNQETEPSASPSPTVKEMQENFTESLGSTVEVQHESPTTDAPLSDFNVTQYNGQVDASLGTSVNHITNSRVIICVLGSVIPLVVLVAITLGILLFRYSQVKKETKKNMTTDGYCWVSSGLDPRLEKLYESIPTDDL